jgi:hypothetical protein
MPYGVIQVDTVKDSLNNTLAPSSSVFRNRIINGAMVIDQRNAGASVTPANTGQYLVDRWQYNGSLASKVTAQQNAGSVTPPIGFINYQGITSSSAYAITASDYFQFLQPIEGLNIADLAWGTANAKTVTLSFQVYSSLTGTFGGSLRNSATNRAYPFSYSVPTANTWTPISVTIAGDTTGTWLTTNGVGIYLAFSLGSGSTFSGTASAWQAGNYIAPTGATSVVGTNGATFYITGVQLEVGTNATNFDYRPYGTELALCQRYYQKYVQPPLRGLTNGSGIANRMAMILPVVMRAAPSPTLGGVSIFDGSSITTVISISTDYSNTNTVEYDFTQTVAINATRPCIVYQTGTASLQLSAEL